MTIAPRLGSPAYSVPNPWPWSPYPDLPRRGRRSRPGMEDPVMTYRRGVSRSPPSYDGRGHQLGRREVLVSYNSFECHFKTGADPVERQAGCRVRRLPPFDLWGGFKERETLLFPQGRSPWRERDRAADLGLGLHDQIERLVSGQTVYRRHRSRRRATSRHSAPFTRTSNPRFSGASEFDHLQPALFCFAEHSDLHHPFCPGTSLPQIVDVKTGRGGLPGSSGCSWAGYRLGEFFVDDKGEEQPSTRHPRGGPCAPSQG